MLMCVYKYVHTRIHTSTHISVYVCVCVCVSNVAPLCRGRGVGVSVDIVSPCMSQDEIGTGHAHVCI